MILQHGSSEHAVTTNCSSLLLSGRWPDRIWFYSDLSGCLPAAMQSKAPSRQLIPQNNNSRFLQRRVQVSIGLSLSENRCDGGDKTTTDKKQYLLSPVRDGCGDESEREFDLWLPHSPLPPFIVVHSLHRAALFLSTHSVICSLILMGVSVLLVHSESRTTS